MQPCGRRTTACLCQVRALIVDSEAELDAIAEHREMPSGTAADVDDGHPFDDRLVEQIDLGLHERADVGRLCGRIEGAIQQARSVDLFVRHLELDRTTSAYLASIEATQIG